MKLPPLILLLFAPLMAWLPASEVRGQAFAQVAFLEITVTDSTMALSDVIVRTGTVKPHRQTRPPAGPYYEVIDARGRVAWSAVFEDPRHRHVEWLDEAGQMQRADAVLGSGVLLLRIPYDPAHQRIDFYEAAASGKQASAPRFSLSLPYQQ